MAKGSMREQMPVVTAFIDQLREVFGREYIDDIIRAGMRGKPVFHATENGHEVGTPVYRGAPLDMTPEPCHRRTGKPAWQAALDQQELDDKKGQGDGSK